MGLNIDPVAMDGFAKHARVHAAALRNAQGNLTVPDDALGTFEEATTLVGLLNKQLRDVNDRMATASKALTDLVAAAETAAGMAGKSDAGVAADMKTVTASVEAAERRLKPSAT